MSQAGSLHYSTWNLDIKKTFAKRKNTWSQIYQHRGGENATSFQIYHLWPPLRSTSECFLSLARQPTWEAKHTWTKWLMCQHTYHLPNGILTLHALPPSSHLQELGMVQQCLSLFPALPTWLTIRSGMACKLVSWTLSATGARHWQDYLHYLQLRKMWNLQLSWGITGHQELQPANLQTGAHCWCRSGSGVLFRNPPAQL